MLITSYFIESYIYNISKKEQNLINLLQVFQSHKHTEQTFALEMQKVLQIEAPMLHKINMILYKALLLLLPDIILRATSTTAKKILYYNINY